MRVLAQINMQGSKGSAIVDDGAVGFTLNAMHGHDVHAVLLTNQPEQSVDNAAAQLSMFSLEELPVSRFPWQASEEDWLTRVATSCSPILPLLTNIGPSGWFGRTSPACFPLTEDETLPASFGGWQNSGTGSPTEFLTLSTSEWPSAAAVCSLSDILETGDVPQRFFLSATACRGILRRAEKRGKKLPEPLQNALSQVVGAKTQTLPQEAICSL